jgi:hypothetical protein
MTSQALSGVIALRLVSREGSPSLLEVRHTHTHTHTVEVQPGLARFDFACCEIVFAL